MASQGVARKSKSAINFPTKPRDEASSDVNNIQRVNKRLRTDSETNSTVMPEVTITNADENLHGSANTNAVIEVPLECNINNYDVIKLDRLIDKSDRYESHKSFLEQCIHSKTIPVGLQINLTPTIGNNDNEFVDKWHKRLEEFSLTIMQDIADFCEKTIQETKQAVHVAKTKVKATATPNENKEIMEAISENQFTRKQNLQRSKDKKFRFLRYNKNNRQYNNQPSYRQQYQQNYPNTNNSNPPRNKYQEENTLQNHNQTRTLMNPVRKRSNTQLERKRSNSRLNPSNEKPRLWSSLLKPPQTNGPSVNRNNDNINLPSNTAAMQDRIKELEQQIANKEQEYDNEKRTQLPKNSRVVPSSGRDNSETNNKTTSNNNAIEIDDILQIISTTMATLRNFENHYKKQGNTSRIL